jgi:hypothetical protein
MTQWTSDKLEKIGRAEEVQIASVRSDGTLGKPVTVWVVRHGDALYVRSVKGRNAHWFRGTQEKHEGRIRAGGVQQESPSWAPTMPSKPKSMLPTARNTTDTPEAFSIVC